MRVGHFFVDRPIFAAVVSIFFVLVGVFAYVQLPVAQYPDIAPPTIVVQARYPGASAEVVAETVAAPLEQEINGVEGMLYLSSQSTGDGSVAITVTFDVGTDLDTAQVLVQNRVAIAEPRLPETVRRLGVTTLKNSPDLMMVVHMLSPDESLDQLYVSNYAILNVKDVLARVDGVGDVLIFGAREYAMRVWVDPERAGQLGLTADDIVRAIRAQNIQVASGALGQSPTATPSAFELSVQTHGRLSEPGEFSNIVVKTGADGRVVRIRDVARVELGARDYLTTSYLDDREAVALVIFQRPGSNALDTARGLLAALDEMAADFPPGLEYRVVYNPTRYIEQSIAAVYTTIGEAVLLVVIVIMLFLKTWRAALIPIVAIPVSLIGAFAVMQAFGFSLNNLTLFGLVLAIGIVVDDAIVVVENVERNIRAGLSPRAAAHKTMDEVGGALIAITLVLFAVFIPTAFLAGLQGQFYRQFALTIAASTGISLIVSLTLSPALAALVLPPHDPGHATRRRPLLLRPIDAFFRGFDRGFAGLSNGYAALTGRLVRLSVLVLVVYAGLVGLGYWQFQRTPTGLVPDQDQRYFIAAFQLPPGASLDRSDAVVRDLIARFRTIDGVEGGVGFAGFDGATFTNAPNAGVVFVTLEDYDVRRDKGISYEGILGQLWGAAAGVREAMVLVIPPPPIQGIGTGGGFKLYVQDRRGRGYEALEQATGAIVAAANQEPGLVGVFSLFNTGTPKIYADIDRVKAEMLGVATSDVFAALETYLGSAYVNDFNLFGRTFQVTVQADAPFREDVRNIQRFQVRNADGDMVPLGSLATFRDMVGPYRVPHYNLYPAAEVQGATLPGFSTGQAIAAIERLTADVLPDGFGFEWTDLAYQEKLVGNTAIWVFLAAVVFVFLLLAAQYESWVLPLAVILIVPMCLLAAVTGVQYRGLDNNLLVQVGLVVLVALAAKNAILIVEFAKQNEDHGLGRLEAAVEAARVRLRPILMTSFAFILGVVPLVIATGAGAELRQSLGTPVLSGMLGVTLFGLIFTPVFYTVCRKLARDPKPANEPPPAPIAGE